MYGKIFSSMYDGTLRVDWKALVTFQQLIVLCDADGIIDMTTEAISGRTGIPIDIISYGLKHLAEPDPYSRTKDMDGRRICLLDTERPWGWFIVNHEKYKALVSSNTIREQNKLRKRKERDMSRPVTQRHAMSRYTDTDTDTYTYTDTNKDIDSNPRPIKKSGSVRLSDQEWEKTIRENVAYSGVDITSELAKMDAWLSTRPGRKKTRRFIVNWLNKVEKSIAVPGAPGSFVTGIEGWAKRYREKLKKQEEKKDGTGTV